MNITKPIAPDTLIARLRDRAATAEDACRADGDSEVYRENFEFDRKVADTLEANNRQLQLCREALTPSAETKAAYHGEFTVPWPIVGEDGNDHIIRINVPWTTIKEIMAAIRDRASIEGVGE